METTSDKRGSNNINKSKYNTFCTELEKMILAKGSINHENMGDFLTLLCDVMKFDPTMKKYDKAKVDRIRQETGMSTYDMFQRKHYLKNKQEMDKKNAAKARKRREEQKITDKMNKLELDHDGVTETEAVTM
jgi:hypothetical protein